MQAEELLRAVDGVMLGRTAYQNPWLLAELQQAWFGAPGVASREQAVAAMSRYLAAELRKGVPAKRVSRHLLGLFQGQPGARRWRRYISENAHLESADERLLLRALGAMRHEGESETGSGNGSAVIHRNALE